MRLKIFKILISLVVFSAITVIISCTSHFGAKLHIEGQMSDCPFMPGHTSVCKMSPMEHMQAWQSMFTTLIEKDALYILYTLLVLFALLGLKYFAKSSLYNLPRLELPTDLGYLKQLLLFDPLREAFSKGILNPKTF